jgi:hypothetical protein
MIGARRDRPQRRGLHPWVAAYPPALHDDDGGLRWPILAAVLSFSLLLVLLLALLMREHEVQLVEMRLFADFGIWSISIPATAST